MQGSRLCVLAEGRCASNIRVTIPRFRYDKLMYLAWRRFLPLSLNYLLFYVVVKCFIFSLL